MNPKSIDSRAGSVHSFDTADEMQDTMEKSNLSGESTSPFVSVLKPQSTTKMDTDAAPKASEDFLQGPPAPEGEKGEVSEKVVDQEKDEVLGNQEFNEKGELPKAQETQGKPIPAPRITRYSPPPSRPLPIPNAVERVRLPAQLPDGLLVMTGARAPVTLEEFEKLKEVEREQHELKQRFWRGKQGIAKWMAEKARDTSTQRHKGEQSDKEVGANWAHRSMHKIKSMMIGGRFKESAIESSSSDERSPVRHLKPTPRNAPVQPIAVGGHLDPTQGAHVGGAITLGEEPNVPEFRKHIMKPFSHQYGHTTATIAYDEGLATGAYQQGYKDGMEKARLDKAYEKGLNDGMKAYQLGPLTASSRSHGSTVISDRPLIFKKDGGAIFGFEIFDGVAKMMDDLDVPRADGLDDAEDGKGKEMAPPRALWEVKAFVKNVSAELEKMEL